MRGKGTAEEHHGSVAPIPGVFSPADFSGTWESGMLLVQSDTLNSVAVWCYREKRWHCVCVYKGCVCSCTG